MIPIGQMCASSLLFQNDSPEACISLIFLLQCLGSGLDMKRYY